MNVAEKVYIWYNVLESNSQILNVSNHYGGNNLTTENIKLIIFTILMFMVVTIESIVSHGSVFIYLSLVSVLFSCGYVLWKYKNQPDLFGRKVFKMIFLILFIFITICALGTTFNKDLFIQIVTISF